ncbi:nuclease [Pseudomonas sp. TTU2014-096BSC]|nr:nuclease [Pseudomonas sp. TTU2014-096BSC]
MRLSEQLRKASLVGAFFVSAFFAAAASAACSPPGPLQVQKVAQVIDGDTLRLVDGRSVRLIGLNTPELGSKGRRAEPFAERARRRLQALVEASGGQVGLHSGEQARDNYGRWLAHAFDSAGNNLEASLLAEGLGYFVVVRPNAALAACHLLAERSAREARLGLWRQSPVQSARNIRQGGFALLEGRVLRVERNRGGIWLELEGGLVVQVPVAALNAFGRGHLEELRGRSVEVRGWVIDRARRQGPTPRSRWLVQVSHPAMLAETRN